MTFLVVAVNTHAKTAKLTTPTLQHCPAQQKFRQKIDFFLGLGCTYNLPLSTTPKNFLALGVHPHPLPPGYAHAICIKMY